MIEAIITGAVSITVALVATLPPLLKLKREAKIARDEMRRGLENRMLAGEDALRKDMMARIDQISRHLEQCEQRSAEQAAKLSELSAQMAVVASEKAMLVGRLAGLEARKHRRGD